MRHEKIAAQKELEDKIVKEINQLQYYKDFLYSLIDLDNEDDSEVIAINKDKLLDVMNDICVQVQLIRSLIDLNNNALKPIMAKVQDFHIKEMKDIIKTFTVKNELHLKSFLYNIEEVSYQYFEYTYLISDSLKPFKAHGLVVDVIINQDQVEFKPRSNLTSYTNKTIKLVINTIFEYEGITVSLYSMYLLTVEKDTNRVWTIYRDGMVKRLALTLQYLANKPELTHLKNDFNNLTVRLLDEHESMKLEMLYIRQS